MLTQVPELKIVTILITYSKSAARIYLWWNVNVSFTFTVTGSNPPWSVPIFQKHNVILSATFEFFNSLPSVYHKNFNTYTIGASKLFYNLRKVVVSLHITFSCSSSDLNSLPFTSDLILNTLFVPITKSRNYKYVLSYKLADLGQHQRVRWGLLSEVLGRGVPQREVQKLTLEICYISSEDHRE